MASCPGRGVPPGTAPTAAHSNSSTVGRRGAASAAMGPRGLWPVTGEAVGRPVTGEDGTPWLRREPSASTAWRVIHRPTSVLAFLAFRAAWWRGEEGGGTMSITMAAPPYGRGRPFTRADLDAMPDDGRRHEIIDGVLIVSAAPGRLHQRAVFRLARLLGDDCTPESE